jgi:hypothetical protein
MCLHKWSKWEEYKVNMVRYPDGWGFNYYEPIRYIEHRQKRYCLKCGKVQYELIR